MQPFKINQDYTVYPDTNTVGNTVKLEPRLMKLLCLLAEDPGVLVTREKIVEKIWNGYGGGDEGLTQAISHLRKVLNDNDKAIIDTVSKGGYIFKGTIGMVNEPANPLHGEVPATRGQISYKVAGIVAATMLVVFTAILYLALPRASRTPKAIPGQSLSPKPAPKAL
jgi:DNA-binding winged helix-turn-helix (wHTH) protein